MKMEVSLWDDQGQNMSLHPHNEKSIKKQRQLARRYSAKAQSEISKISEIKVHREVPKYFRDYTRGKVDIVIPTAHRTGIEEEGYEGPAETIPLNLALEGEPDKIVYVGAQLDIDQVEKLRRLLMKYRDVLAWNYTDLKGIPPHITQHTIPLIEGARPKACRPYPMNPKYAEKVKEELNKLLEAGFIYEIEHSEWVSPIAIDPKKTRKIQICVNFKNLNVVK